MEQKPKNTKKPPSRGFNPSWLYIFMFIFLFGLYFSNTGTGPKEISYLEFEQNMLSEHDVERIVVVNKEIAEIYIKKEKLNEDKYHDVASDTLLGASNPQYLIKIGSLENFENKLDRKILLSGKKWN